MGGNMGIPEFKYHPEKGLNVNVDPMQLQQLMQMIQRQMGPQGGNQAGIGLVKDPRQAFNFDLKQPGQQGMPSMPIPQNYQRPM